MRVERLNRAEPPRSPGRESPSAQLGGGISDTGAGHRLSASSQGEFQSAADRQQGRPRRTLGSGATGQSRALHQVESSLALGTIEHELQTGEAGERMERTFVNARALAPALGAGAQRPLGFWWIGLVEQRPPPLKESGRTMRAALSGSEAALRRVRPLQPVDTIDRLSLFDYRALVAPFASVW